MKIRIKRQEEIINNITNKIHMKIYKGNDNEEREKKRDKTKEKVKAKSDKDRRNELLV